MNNKQIKWIGMIVLIAFLNQILFTTVSFALTTGPSLPETESFSPVNATDMVDLFTGDVSYNIPLLDVGGYPINLFYTGGVSMDQEASWVGLGWNLNVGSITRQMRGIPDDFKEDVMKKEFHIQDNVTWGINTGVGFQLGGMKRPTIKVKLGVMQNTQKGLGLCFGANAGISSGSESKGKFSANLGLNFSSFDGASLSASAQAGAQDMSANISGEIGSRGGLKSLGFSCTSMLQKLTTHHNQSMDNEGNVRDNGGVSQAGNPASVSFTGPNYLPFSTFPMKNTSFSFQGTVGVEAWTAHPNFSLGGYYSKQETATDYLNSQGFGYLYSGYGKDNNMAQHDYTREKDHAFAKTIPAIAIPNYTYDLFAVNAQGLSGQFRGSRNDVGVLYDRSIYSTNESSAIGVEIGFAAIIHGGADFTVNEVNTKLTKWATDNQMKSYVGFRDPAAVTNNEENVCFRLTGEQVPASSGYMNKLKNDNLMHIGLLGVKPSAPNYFNMYSNTNQDQGLYYVNSQIKRDTRENRNMVWSYLTAEEAQHQGLEKTINDYRINTLVAVPCSLSNNALTPRPRQDNIRKSHHISEVTILKDDGKRFVFGIPTYNEFQKEVTFSVADNSSDSINCTYNSSDPTVGNDKGRDQYFAADNIPGYSNAFLLTGILSPDYVDRSSNGISPDDYGTAIKFNYTKMPYSFGWRTPFLSDKFQASYNEGYEVDDKDSKGSYVYGRKEIWYAHSIESNNYLIQFYLEDREDGLGAKNEDGEIDINNKQKLIKEIRLYSKADVVQYGNNAVPIKTVHFVYDYSLCDSVPNNLLQANPSYTNIDNSSGSLPYYTDTNEVNGGGKLTLKKIYFTYGNSNFGAINSYEFKYFDEDPALVFQVGHSDRWGTYKEPGTLTNAAYPYTDQDTSLTNNYVRYWMLSDVYLPSGGAIHIEYESDDYAYVQDKRAMQMFPIEGFSNNLHSSVPATFSSQLYNGNSTYNFVYFRFPSSLGILTKPQIKKLFLEEVFKRYEPYIYYKMKVDICNKGVYDYVSGYAKVNDYGVIGTSNVGWLQLSHVEGYNPIAQQAWLAIRQGLAQVAYPGSSGSTDILTAITSLISSIGEITSIFVGFSKFASDKNFGRYTQPEASFIRLCNPDFKKLGGGHRVKQVTITDNWALMDTLDNSSFYGQNYHYTMQEEVNGVLEQISSGVAVYEPIVGGDENPFRYPRNYKIEKKFGLGPTDRLYVEEPFGESMFPSASVGYRRVMVTPLDYPNVSRSKAGTTVQEFYTAYDFPVIWNSTLLKSEASRKTHETNFLLKLFGFLPVEDYQAASQGFVIQTNDMHGKTKKTSELDANGQLLSSTSYFYKVENQSVSNKKLISEVPVVAKDGSISMQTVGLTEDMWTDMRQEESIMKRYGVQANLDVIMIPLAFIILVIPIILPYPEFGLEKTRFRSAALVKQIHRVGILDKTETVVEGARNFKQNILFDGVTGESILTSSRNEFRDTIYDFHYPAHWMYSNMGAAFMNIGSQFKGVTITAGVHNNSAIDTYCSNGDELIYKIGTSTQPVKIWASATTNGIRFIDFNGDPVGDPVALSNVNLKVVKSGRKNMLTSQTGNISFLKDKPIDVNGSGEYLALNLEKRVLNASITEYEHQWKSNCEQIPYTYTTPVPFTCDPPPNECASCCQAFYDSLNSMITAAPASDLFHINQAENYSLWNIIPYLDCRNWLPCPSEVVTFYSLDPTLEYSNHYEFGIGNCCRVMMDGVSEIPFHIDSVSKIIYEGDCCADVYAYGSGDNDSLVARACIYCSEEPVAVCIDKLEMRDTINPFVLNMENNWHAKKTWAYNEKRTDFYDYYHFVRDHGDYKDFEPFWTYTSNAWVPDVNADRWVKANEVTAINRLGSELENKNALNISSSVLFGFTESLVKAEAANSRYRNVANDNFEDYNFPNNCLEPCYMEHWNFIDAVDDVNILIADTISHTGLHSLKLTPGSTASVHRSIEDLDSLPVSRWVTDHFELYHGCNYKFAPDTGKYVISAWVKEDTICNVLGYDQNQMDITFSGSGVTYSFQPSGLVIEGWQRYYEIFEVPSGVSGITVKLSSNGNTTYFDDIRIQPFNSGMKTYVHNKNNLRLMASLDENNYATFYEYDDQGILIRTKKETERGILTLIENKRTLLKK